MTPYEWTRAISASLIGLKRVAVVGTALVVALVATGEGGFVTEWARGLVPGSATDEDRTAGPVVRVSEGHLHIEAKDRELLLAFTERSFPELFIERTRENDHLRPSERLRPGVGLAFPQAGGPVIALDRRSGFSITMVPAPPVPPTLLPEILNRGQVARAIQTAYPTELRDRGVARTVVVQFLVNPDGSVERIRIRQNSGNDALDRAALDAASAYRFSPGYVDDEPVAIWASAPVVFRP